MHPASPGPGDLPEHSPSTEKSLECEVGQAGCEAIFALFALFGRRTANQLEDHWRGDCFHSFNGSSQVAAFPARWPAVPPSAAAVIVHNGGPFQAAPSPAVRAGGLATNLPAVPPNIGRRQKVHKNHHVGLECRDYLALNLAPFMGQAHPFKTEVPDAQFLSYPEVRHLMTQSPTLGAWNCRSRCLDWVWGHAR